MADTDDTSVMFEIGVMEHPATRARIEALQKQVLDTQAKMVQGVERVGAAAQSVSSAVAPIEAMVRGFSQSSVDGLDDMRGAITRLVAAAEKKIQIDVNVQGRSELEALLAQIKGAKNTGDSSGSVGGSSPAKLPKPDTTSVSEAFEELPASLRNVFKTLGNDAREAADEIGDAFEKRLSGIANTAGLNNGFSDQMRSQVEKFAAASRELDDALDAKGESVEMLNANMVKATRSVIGAAKGFAELGLVSKENSEEMLKGLVVIQGAFDIFDGAADLLESFSGGWKAVKQSTDAAAAATKLQQTLMGPQFALMRAYQAQLVQEAASANVAALANTRLGQSRGMGGAGGVASSAGGAVVQGVAGAAGKVGAGAVGSAASGGAAFMSTSVGGVTTGLLTSVAALGAALASVALVSVETAEVLSGNANNQKGITDKIASAEISLLASVLEMTGTFELVNSSSSVMSTGMNDFTRKVGGGLPVIGNLISSLGFLGDASALAGSNVSTAKAEKSLAANKLQSDFAEQKSNIVRGGANELAIVDFRARAARSRSDAEVVGTNDSKVATEMKIQAEALARITENQRALEKSRSGEGTAADGDIAAKNIAFFENELQASQGRQTRLGVGKVDASLDAELQIQKEATAEMQKQQAIADQLRADGVKNSDELEKAESQAAKFRQDALQSLQKQKELVKERSEIEAQGQQRIGDLLKSQIELKSQQLQKSKDEQTGAARNFAKLNTFEKEQSLKALEQARAKGASSLNDRQKDLLRSVGTQEAVRFANEGDDAEATKFGFNDKNFGKGFAQEQTALTDAKRKLEAQLSTTYDVTVVNESNSEQIVSDVAAAVNKILETERSTIQSQIESKVGASTSELVIRFSDMLRQAKK